MAGRIAEAVRAAVRAGTDINLVLSGGRTPEGLYRMLAAPPYREEIRWDLVHFFFGDERCVPPEHEASNYRMAATALLDRVPVKPDRIHRICGELGPEEGARRYELLLEQLVGTHRGACFDIVLLGVGPDGHTASIFPAKGVRPDYLTRRVAPVTEGHPPGPARITLTPRALNSSRSVFFLVQGVEKAEVLRRLVSGSDPGPYLPASMIHPLEGGAEFFSDSAGASALASHSPVEGVPAGKRPA